MDRQNLPSVTWNHRGAWTGGTVTDVLLLPGAPATWIAASRAGLFTSQDGGKHWQRSSQGLDDPSVLALAAATDRSGRTQLFASTETGRLYRSLDKGSGWQELTGWAGLGIITAMAVSPNFAADGTLFAATPQGPFRSQDGGQSWESAMFGLIDLEILCLAIDPEFADNETLWLGTAGGGLYHSRNGGRSWRDAGIGLPSTAIQCLLVTGSGDEQILLAGTEEYGLFRRTPHSPHWTPLSPELRESGINCLAAISNGDLIAGSDDGLLFSQDGGETWQNSQQGDVIPLALSVSDDQTVLAATWQSGVLCSADGGKSWQPCEGQSANLALHAPPLAVISPDGVLFLADLDGGWVAADLDSLRWQPVDVEMQTPLTALVSSGEADDFVLMAGGGTTLYRCFAGEEWESRTLPMEIAQIALSPDYLNDGTVLVVDLAGTLHRSQDDGDTWEALSPPWTERTPVGMAFSPKYSQDETVYVVTVAALSARVYQVEVWRSTDGGESWIVLAGFEDESPVISLLPLADADDSLWLGVQSRLIRLFTDVDDGQLAVEQHHLPQDVRITALAVKRQETEPNTLLVATNQGVWQATDADWKPLGQGIESQSVVGILTSPQGHLWAVTLGGEIWQLQGR